MQRQKVRLKYRQKIMQYKEPTEQKSLLATRMFTTKYSEGCQECHEYRLHSTIIC